MGWFRRKTEILDAEHLIQDTAQTESTTTDFRLTISDVFVIRNRGTVVTGQVEAGSVSVGSEVAVTRDAQVLRRVEVSGIEMFRKTMETAVAGQNVGVLLRSVGREDVATGDVLTA